MLKQALDVLKKAEADAEQAVSSARRRSTEIRGLAEAKKAEAISSAIAAAEVEASEIVSKYEAESNSIKAAAERRSVEESNLIAKTAADNKVKALNKAVERIVRRNGHR